MGLQPNRSPKTKETQTQEEEVSQLEHSTRHSDSVGDTCPMNETPPNFTARKTSPEQLTGNPPEHTGTGCRMRRNRRTTLENKSPIIFASIKLQLNTNQPSNIDSPRRNRRHLWRKEET
ncbi:hypothetical protein YC2023_047376 [Brassica napus]